MKVLVSGSREFNNEKLLYTELQKLSPELIIQGGARGADALAEMFAVQFGIPCIEMRANWTFFHKAAGPIRNGWMLKYCNPDILLAFPLEGSVGTVNMISQAEKAGLEVRICKE